MATLSLTKPGKITIYGTQFNRSHDYGPAYEHGDSIVWLVNHEWYVTDKPDPNNQQIVKRMKNIMHSYRPGVDYLLFTGGPMSVFLAGLIVKSWDYTGSHLVLKWNNVTRKYDKCAVPNLV